MELKDGQRIIGPSRESVEWKNKSMNRESIAKEIFNLIDIKFDGTPSVKDGLQAFNKIADWHINKMNLLKDKSYSAGWTHCADEVRDVLDE